NKRTEATKRSIRLRSWTERLPNVIPYRCGDNPTQKVDVGDARQRQNEDRKTDDQRERIFADPGRQFDVVSAARRCTGPSRGTHGMNSLLSRQRAAGRRER